MVPFLKKIAYISIFIGMLCILYGLVLYCESSAELTKLKDMAIFFSGTVQLCFTFATVLFVFISFKRQNEIIERDKIKDSVNQFENTLFRMLDFNQKIVSELTIDINADNEIIEFAKGKDITLLPGSHIGRNAFKILYVKLWFEYNALVPKQGSQTELVKNSYTAFDNKYQHFVGNYFKTLSFILKLIYDFKDIKKDERGKKDKKYYASIVKAQLSKYELLLLHYDGLSKYGEMKISLHPDKSLKDLIEEFNIFEFLNTDDLLGQSMDKLYNDSAYITSSQK